MLAINFNIDLLSLGWIHLRPIAVKEGSVSY